MIRKYHNNKLQTNTWHREEEPHSNHETPGRQTKQSNQLSLLHRDDCKTRRDTKIYSQGKKIRKRRLFKKVQAFCEEKVLRCLLGVFLYAESKNQCWQAEKWRLHYLICIFPRWPPN